MTTPVGAERTTLFEAEDDDRVGREADCPTGGLLDFLRPPRNASVSDREGYLHNSQSSLASRHYRRAGASDSSAAGKQSVPGGSWTRAAYRREFCPGPEGSFPAPPPRTSLATK